MRCQCLSGLIFSSFQGQSETFLTCWQVLHIHGVLLPAMLKGQIFLHSCLEISWKNLISIKRWGVDIILIFLLSENCKYHIIWCLKTLIARYGHFDIWSHRWQSLRDNSIKQLNDTINVKQKNHFWLGPFYPSSSDSNAFLLYLESIIKTSKREVQGNFSVTGWLAGWVTRISAQSF